MRFIWYLCLNIYKYTSAWVYIHKYTKIMQVNGLENGHGNLSLSYIHRWKQQKTLLHIFGLVSINQFTGWAVERGELVRDAYWGNCWCNIELSHSFSNNNSRGITIVWTIQSSDNCHDEILKRGKMLITPKGLLNRWGWEGASVLGVRSKATCNT